MWPELLTLFYKIRHQADVFGNKLLGVHLVLLSIPLPNCFNIEARWMKSNALNSKCPNMFFFIIANFPPGIYTLTFNKNRKKTSILNCSFPGWSYHPGSFVPWPSILAYWSNDMSDKLNTTTPNPIASQSPCIKYQQLLRAVSPTKRVDCNKYSAERMFY